MTAVRRVPVTQQKKCRWPVLRPQFRPSRSGSSSEPPKKTKPADFQLQNGSTVEVDMMSKKSLTATFRSDKVQMAELAYGDSLYKMTILTPAEPKPD